MPLRISNRWKIIFFFFLKKKESYLLITQTGYMYIETLAA